VTPNELAAMLRRNPQLVARDQTNPPMGLTAMAAAEVDAAMLALAANAGALGGMQMPARDEHDEQVALFQWADAAQAQHPELAMLHATPNGGYRPMVTAVRLKAEGVRKGYPDISLDVARGRWHGLRIELKRADHSNGPTAEQREWIARLRYYGYSAVVAYGAAEAQQVIMAYLAQEG
jgi:hypothetical protein